MPHPAADPSGTAPPDPWDTVAAARFVSLTTYRRDGRAVATPVWISRDGSTLVVTSEAATGKVRRLRNDGRVRLRPCSRFGEVAPGAVTLDATAEVAGPDHEHPGAVRALRAKYGIQVPLVLGLERLVRRVQRRPGARVIIRVAGDRPGA